MLKPILMNQYDNVLYKPKFYPIQPKGHPALKILHCYTRHLET